MGKESQRIQRERRIAALDADQVRDMMQMPTHGEAIGAFEYRCFRTGQVKRWTILLGDRVDRVILRSPDGRKTGAHGWTWVMDHLRGKLCGRR
jgi:hypothetical protein